MATKKSYKKGFEHKRRVRDYIFPIVKGETKHIIGLAGPSIKQYHDWCKGVGFKKITSYEYLHRVYVSQMVLRNYYGIDMGIHKGSINIAPLVDDAVYDIDLCDSLSKQVNLEIIHRFKDTKMVLTVCQRPLPFKDTVKRFFDSIGERILSLHQVDGKSLGMGNVTVSTYTTTNRRKYMFIPYKDKFSPPMLCIARTH